MGHDLLDKCTYIQNGACEKCTLNRNCVFGTFSFITRPLASGPNTKDLSTFYWLSFYSSSVLSLTYQSVTVISFHDWKFRKLKCQYKYNISLNCYLRLSSWFQSNTVPQYRQMRYGTMNDFWTRATLKVSWYENNLQADRKWLLGNEVHPSVQFLYYLSYTGSRSAWSLSRGLGAQGTAMIYKQINRLINNACFFLIVWCDSAVNTFTRSTQTLSLAFFFFFCII